MGNCFFHILQCLLLWIDISQITQTLTGIMGFYLFIFFNPIMIISHLLVLWSKCNLIFSLIGKFHLFFLQHKLWPQWKRTHEGNSSGGIKMLLKTSPKTSAQGQVLQNETAYSTFRGLNLWLLYAHCDVLSSYATNNISSLTFLCDRPSLGHYTLSSSEREDTALILLSLQFRFPFSQGFYVCFYYLYGFIRFLFEYGSTSVWISICIYMRLMDWPLLWF